MSPENLALVAEPVIRAALREDMPFGDVSLSLIHI